VRIYIPQGSTLVEKDVSEKDLGQMATKYWYTLNLILLEHLATIQMADENSFTRPTTLFGLDFDEAHQKITKTALIFYKNNEELLAVAVSERKRHGYSVTIFLANLFAMGYYSLDKLFEQVV
jgi:hypothetical protein